MSNKRLIVQVSSKYTTRDGSEKWRNANVGSAFVRDNGEVSLMLDPGVAIASVEGVRITLREPFDKNKHGGGGSGQRSESPGYDEAPSSYADDGSSDIPF